MIRNLVVLGMVILTGASAFGESLTFDRTSDQKLKTIVLEILSKPFLVRRVSETQFRSAVLSIGLEYTQVFSTRGLSAKLGMQF